MILAFAHPCLVVPDLEKASRFYHQMFGFEVISNEGWRDSPDMDRAIGELFVRLRAHHALDDALVVFVSDHGEEFLEHGRISHGWQLFDETLAVPLSLTGFGASALSPRVEPAPAPIARPPEPLRVAVLSDLNGNYGATHYIDPVHAAVRRVVEPAAKQHPGQSLRRIVG